MKILITGGAGYIGSTIASALEDSGHTPVILDSLVTGRLSSPAGAPFIRAISPIERWSGRFSVNIRIFSRSSTAPR